MYLVYDINSVFELRGGIYYLVTNASYVLYAVVGSRVHFKNVGSGARLYAKTRGAFSARASVNGRKTVERLGKNLCAGGLTRTARSAEKVCVAICSVFYLISKNGSDMLLTYHLVKGSGTPFTI